MTVPTIHIIAAARPNFMKVAPLYHALALTDWCRPEIVHTGQHYDFNMSEAFIRDLGLPDPHFHLGIGSGTHAEQTGAVMIAYEKICIESRPDWIIVVGDVNSTAACAIVGAKLCIPVAHLEAGLRSGDRRMPEEINRLLTDSIADLLWTPSVDADANLIREGVANEKIEMIGNIMIDSFELLRRRIERSATREDLGLGFQDYAVLTLHRPSNVDDLDRLSGIVEALLKISVSTGLVFVAHPRALKNLEKFRLLDRVSTAVGISLVEPLPYIEFMNLLLGARFAITDSGGLQEETTYLNIPCLTLRENTERPITVSQGTNKLVNPAELEDCVSRILNNDWPAGDPPPYWDGMTAARAVDSLKRRLAAN